MRSKEELNRGAAVGEDARGGRWKLSGVTVGEEAVRVAAGSAAVLDEGKRGGGEGEAVAGRREMMGWRCRVLA